MKGGNPGPAMSTTNAFLERCGDLVDVVTVHRYPGGGYNTLKDAMHYTEVWDKIIPEIQKSIDKYCVQKWQRKAAEVKIGVSEWSFANKHNCDPKLGEQWSSAIWSADALCRFMQNNVFMAAYWAASSDFHGFFNQRDTRCEQPNPVYHTFKFISSFVDAGRGAGSSLVDSSGAPSLLMVYPVLKDQKLSVILINSKSYDSFSEKLFYAHS